MTVNYPASIHVGEEREGRGTCHPRCINNVEMRPGHPDRFLIKKKPRFLFIGRALGSVRNGCANARERA